jgi:hypothetical protein
MLSMGARVVSPHRSTGCERVCMARWHVKCLNRRRKTVTGVSSLKAAVFRRPWNSAMEVGDANRYPSNDDAAEVVDSGDRTPRRRDEPVGRSVIRSSGRADPGKSPTLRKDLLYWPRFRKSRPSLGDRLVWERSPSTKVSTWLEAMGDCRPGVSST